MILLLIANIDIGFVYSCFLFNSRASDYAAISAPEARQTGMVFRFTPNPIGCVRSDNLKRLYKHTPTLKSSKKLPQFRFHILIA